jgi:hypothetical protein
MIWDPKRMQQLGSMIYVAIGALLAFGYLPIKMPPPLSNEIAGILMAGMGVIMYLHSGRVYHPHYSWPDTYTAAQGSQIDAALAQAQDMSPATKIETFEVVTPLKCPNCGASINLGDLPPVSHSEAKLLVTCEYCKQQSQVSLT